MIIGFSEMITQAPQVYGQALPAPLMADIGAIQRNSHHLLQLVDDVLDLSQVDSRRMAVSKEWVRIDEVVSSAADTVRLLFESKGLYLRTEIASELPPVFCDITRVRQVLINLLSNAGRFTEEGGVAVTVRREGPNVRFSVTDSGPGIPEDAQARIFEPFHQLDNSIRRKHGGSGLGLSISKRFIELHDGRMWLESEVGQGTTFNFELPCTVTRPVELQGGDARRWFNPYQPYEPRTRPYKAPVPKLLPRYVVIEEGNELQRLLKRYLTDAEVVSVPDMDAAVADLRKLPAQALLLNGFPSQEVSAMVRGLQGLPYGIPAVAFWMPVDTEVTQRLGVVDYLVKPIARERLLGALDAASDAVETVLLVDDSPEVLQLFGRMLVSGENRYRVLRATAGRQALHLMRTRKPDVVLLDLIMPDLDGFQVLQEKAADSRIRDIPVIVISSRDATNAPITSNAFAVVRGQGMSLDDLIACVEAISGILSPLRAPQRTPAGPG
jgi:CheY-like chemotaxis protein